MKKIVLTLLAVVAFSGAFAQISYGVKVGMNISSLSNVSGTITSGKKGFTVNGKNRTGFNIGAVAEYRPVYRLGVQGELVYSLQGSGMSATYMSGDLGSISEVKFNLHYLNLPILAKLYLTDALAIEVGPQFGYCLGHTYDEKISTGGTKGTISNDAINDFDVALAMGASIKFGSLGINARYNMGLANVSDGLKFAGYNVDGSKNIKNNTLQMGLFFMF